MHVSTSNLNLNINNRNKPLGTYYTDKEIVNGIIAVVKWHYSDLPSGDRALNIVKSRCQNYFYKIDTNNFATANLYLQDYVSFSNFLYNDVLNRNSDLNRLCNRRTFIVSDCYFELWSSQQQRYMTNKFQTITLSSSNQSLTIEGERLWYQSEQSGAEIKVHYIAQSVLSRLKRVIEKEKKDAAEWKARMKMVRMQQQREKTRIEAHQRHVNAYRNYRYANSIQKHFKDCHGFFINKNYQRASAEDTREIQALQNYVKSIDKMIDCMNGIDDLYKNLVQFPYQHRHPVWDIVAGKKFTQTQSDRMAFLKFVYFELAKTTCKRIIIAFNIDPLHNKTSDLRQAINQAFLIDHHRCSIWSPVRLGKTKLRKAIEQRMQFQNPSTKLNLSVVKYIPIPGRRLALFIPSNLQIHAGLDRISYLGALMERSGPGGYNHGLSISALRSCKNDYSNSIPAAFLQLAGLR